MRVLMHESGTSAQGGSVPRRALMALIVLALAFAGTLFPVIEARAGTPPGFRETAVISGLNNPTAMSFLPDGRVLVAEKGGTIQLFDGVDDTTPTLAADLRTKVHNFWDRGLLGFTVHPDFANQPYLYALYTHDAPIGGAAPRWGTAASDSDSCPDPPGATEDGCVASGRLSRLRLGAGGIAGPEQVLIEDWCIQYPSHTVGTLAFGGDGALYASAGDGASFTFVDYGQEGAPVNPCGDPGGVGGAMTPPGAQGGALRAQDLRTPGDPVSLDGSVIRVDPATGAGLPDNPRAASPDANARRIVAHGFRNPFRFAVRPGTSELWVGDVGWSGQEEINRIAEPAAAPVENFGWPCYEGAGRSGYDGAGLGVCESLYAEAGAETAPYLRYAHSEDLGPNGACPAGGSSVTGVAFYSGGAYPDEYDGAMFFADYSRRCIMVVPEGANGLPDPAQRRPFVTDAANPVGLQTGPDGNLYYLDLLGGTIRRIEYVGEQPVVNCPAGDYLAEYFANPTLSGEPVLRRCEATIDNDWGVGAPAPGLPVNQFSVRWSAKRSFDGGDVAFSATGDDGIRMRLDEALVLDGWRDQGPTTYTQARTVAAGEHDVVVEYYEATGGAVASFSYAETVNANAPTPTIATPATGFTWKVGDPIVFSGSATDRQDGTLAASALSWSLLVNHCPSSCHVHPVEDRPGVATGSFNAPDHEHPSWLELRLTATDSSGMTGTTSVRLDPKTVDLTFDTVPSGLLLTVGSETVRTPFTRKVIQGSLNSLSAPSPQEQGTSAYEFASWSDGGAATHNITAAAASRYVATYAAAGTVSCQSGQYLAEYFANQTLSGTPVLRRCEAAIDNDWGGAAPAPGVPADQFSVRWRGTHTFTGGNVAFRVTGDDGIRMSLDGALVLDGWKDQGPTLYEATRAVTAGAHEVVVEYYENGGGATARAGWSAPVQAVTCPAGQYLAEYFPNMTLTGTPVVRRCETAIANDWGEGVPAPGLGANQFSVRWRGTHSFAGGSTTFRLTGDDGIRMSLDGTRILDGWKDQGPTTYETTRAVTAGAHEVVVEYYENTGGATARAGWNAP